MLCDNQFCLATMTLYFSAVWTQSGESGNTLKIKCSDTSDERANIFPCLQRPKSSAVANVRWATLCLTLTKQAFRKDDSVERKPTILAHFTAKEKPRRYLRGNALGIDRASRRETRLSEPFRSRHQARLTIARRWCRNAQKFNNSFVHIFEYYFVKQYPKLQTILHPLKDTKK